MMQVEQVVDFLKDMGCKVPVLLFADILKCLVFIQSNYQEYQKAKLAAIEVKRKYAERFKEFSAGGNYSSVYHNDQDVTIP